MAKNEHPTYCPGCMKDLGRAVDLGQSNRVHMCGDCSNYYTGAVWPGKCPVCGGPPAHQNYIKSLSPMDAVPGDMCHDCLSKQAEMDQAVKAGGIYFQCAGCGTDGVFSASTSFAQRVREETKKPAPQDVFVQIKACPQCPVYDDKAQNDNHTTDTELDGLVDAILSDA